MDTLMFLCGITLMLLFAFLMFITLAIIFSWFIKQEFDGYEPYISVVIPTYNEEKNIDKCLKSISSDYKNIEIIIVDDGSTDKTREIVKGYQVRLIKAKHKGKSAALTLGAKNAKYDIILTIDADTLVKKGSISKLVAPFKNKNIAATNGSSLASNQLNLLTAFQKIEYMNNNLIRRSFSRLFKNSIWFFGAFCAYRKSVLEEIGYFKGDTMAEDMDISLEIYSLGLKIVNVDDAIGYTMVPCTLKEFIIQRTRWWRGVLQALKKNIHLFSLKSNPSILFLFVNQWWWTFYGIISFFILGYQFRFWLPNGYLEIFYYAFRWFSLAGPIYVLYKIPEWGISFYSIFGVLSGIINVFILYSSMKLFNEKMSFANIFVVFFYFPYTILLNVVILLSLLMPFKKGFIK